MKLRIALSIALSAVLAPVLVPPYTAAAIPPPLAVAGFAPTSQWDTGYVGRITVRNSSPFAISGWRLQFDLAAGTSITSSWNGSLSRSGNSYTVTPESWNNNLASGATTSFGWVAAGSGTPQNCTLYGVPCAGTAQTDHRAPTRPGPLTISLAQGVVLNWGASTDEQAVHYEVHESGRLVATVAGTEYVYSSSSALPPRIYFFSVRAFDPSGNVSASVWETFGQIWRGDEVPPAPSTPSITYVCPAHFRVSWAPVEVTPPLSVPPVAGYEVSVDGRAVLQVGGTSVTLPMMGAGPHTISVRTINAVNQLSEPVSATIG